VERSKSNTGDNFYFRKKEGHVLTEKPLNGSPDKIVLVLKNFRADPEGGTRTIRAEMFYGPLLKNKKQMTHLRWTVIFFLRKYDFHYE
jgi:hypothetical protein